MGGVPDTYADRIQLRQRPEHLLLAGVEAADAVKLSLFTQADRVDVAEGVKFYIGIGQIGKDMALGNVIGSNIFNILLVLGVAAAISPVKFLTDNIIDTVVLIAMSLVVLVFAWTSKMIDRREGATMLGMYAVYMAYICIR